METEDDEFDEKEEHYVFGRDSIKIWFHLCHYRFQNNIILLIVHENTQEYK